MPSSVENAVWSHTSRAANRIRVPFGSPCIVTRSWSWTFDTSPAGCSVKFRKPVSGPGTFDTAYVGICSRTTNRAVSTSMRDAIGPATATAAPTITTASAERVASAAAPARTSIRIARTITHSTPTPPKSSACPTTESGSPRPITSTVANPASGGSSGRPGEREVIASPAARPVTRTPTRYGGSSSTPLGSISGWVPASSGHEVTVPPMTSTKICPSSRADDATGPAETR